MMRPGNDHLAGRPKSGGRTGRRRDPGGRRDPTLMLRVTMLSDTVAARLHRVTAAVAEAAEHAGRAPAAVRLVGISKGSSAGAVAEAIAAGLRDIGENRVQEAADKIARLSGLTPGLEHWHLVGHLQSNKARVATQLFDTIQSVDSVRIAETLDRLTARPLRVLLEVQYAPTPGRIGFDPEYLEDVAMAVSRLTHLEVVGLMTVAPLGLDETAVRAVFRDLRERREQLRTKLPGLVELSMGMSDDFRIAIAEGATMVRIGRAIFGS